MGENYFGKTDTGKQRDNNEDSFIVQPVFNKKRILACVIDGVGGYEGGEIAAGITRDTVLQKLNKMPAHLINAMVDALETANQRIYSEKLHTKANEKMACVVTLAVVDPESNSLSYVHVGDTRLYLFRDSSLVKITRDHSTVGFLEESGRLSETAAMQHPKRNEVNKALGYEADSPLAKDFFDSGESPFLPGDIILLCSDGLTDMVGSAMITEILKENISLENKVNKLIDAANEAGGKDNITVVLVQNSKPPVKHAVTKPQVASQQNNNIEEENEPALTKDDYVNLGANELMNEPVKKTSKSKSGLVSLLAILCILFFAGFAWYFYKTWQAEQQPKVLMPPPVIQKTPTQLNLRDSIDSGQQNKIIKLSTGSILVISDSIIIDKDSLHIEGNGVTLVADSSYKGAAFILQDSCKDILLDSLTLSGFDVGVLVKNKGLHLKNVKFINCKVPVQFAPSLPQNIFITGAQADRIFNLPDTTIRK